MNNMQEQYTRLIYTQYLSEFHTNKIKYQLLAFTHKPSNQSFTPEVLSIKVLARPFLGIAEDVEDKSLHANSETESQNDLLEAGRSTLTSVGRLTRRGFGRGGACGSCTLLLQTPLSSSLPLSSAC